jgi:two-component system OmpR family sensor kinase/two-component system sensor histidine kinase BaeS
MRSLFWKGMLAFLAIILIAVGTVALVAGRATESEFRRYTVAHGGAWNRQVVELAAYYTSHGSWEGLQETLPTLVAAYGRGMAGGGMGSPRLDFRLADAQGRIVGDTANSPTGTAARVELESGIPITIRYADDDQTVGYLLPASQASTAVGLDESQAQFLARVRTSLWAAALAALAAALIIGVLLFRSITAPLRHLTTASRAIAAGDLSARAPVQGQDEVAQLADAFNTMAESLSRAQEARQNQTADVAHELRTPLTVLQGTLEAMVDGVFPTDQENLLVALGQVQTLTRLVEDLRVLALADAGQLHLRTATLDLGPFVREIVEAHRPQAQERAINLALEASPNLPQILIDRDRVAQVLGNLLNNALRYVPEGGHVVVRVREQEQEVAVSVADDGPGVRPEDLPRLFERFWRGDPARRRATGGSGLGLAIARHIVGAHGGRIWAESTAGGGLTVTFTIPLVRARIPAVGFS